MSSELGKYKPYPEYKESGVEWLDLLPSDWKTNALKFALSIPMTDGPHETPTFTDEGIPFVSAEAVSSGTINFDKIRGYISEEDNRRFSLKYKPKLHDVYMIKSGATTGVSAIVETDIKFNIWSPLAVMRVNADFSPYYLLSYLRSNTFQEQVQLNWSFGTQQNIGMGTLENIGICCPPIEEQQSIASFLDYETARIDSLIAKQQQLIELLKEKRQAVISHVVTKGLNPDVPMKDSGVEWLGQVPEHWNVLSLKYHVKTRKGVAFKAQDFCDDGIPVVKASDIKQLSIRTLSTCLPDAFRYSYPNAVLNSGDIVLSTVGSTPDVKNSAVGQLGMVPVNVAGSLLNQNTVIFDSNENRYLKQFLFLILQSTGYRDHLDLHAHGTANQASLNISDMLDFRFAAPPIPEQEIIVETINFKLLKLIETETSCQQAIELLTERRTALISESVTGKIDLRNWAPPVTPSDDVA